MKFRPQMQLRFRDEAQFIAVKNAARTAAVSVNEWVLQCLEGGGTGIRGTPIESGDSGSRRVSRGVEAPSPAVGSSPTPPTKRTHDPKTCRVYGCLQCKEAK